MFGALLSWLLWALQVCSLVISFSDLVNVIKYNTISENKKSRDNFFFIPNLPIFHLGKKPFCQNWKLVAWLLNFGFDFFYLTTTPKLIHLIIQMRSWKKVFTWNTINQFSKNIIQFLYVSIHTLSGGSGNYWVSFFLLVCCIHSSWFNLYNAYSLSGKLTLVSVSDEW